MVYSQWDVVPAQRSHSWLQDMEGEPSISETKPSLDCSERPVQDKWLAHLQRLPENLPKSLPQ